MPHNLTPFRPLERQTIDGDTQPDVAVRSRQRFPEANGYGQIAAAQDEASPMRDAVAVIDRSGPRRLHISPQRLSVFAPGTVLTARLPPSVGGENTDDPHLCDAYTGPIMAIAGDAPVISSAGVASPCGLDLLGAAGLPVSREIRTYRTADEFRRLVREASRDEERIAFQHVHSVDDVPAATCLVAPDLLQFLNNKANLPDLVGQHGAPRRSSISAADAAALGADRSWVLKVCSDHSSGGGYGVYVHRAGRVLKRPDFIHEGAQLIIEEYLDFVENWCVHFSVDVTGTAQLLGATEQLITDTGAYSGSRVGGVAPPPAALALCRGAVERAQALGFIGYCGVDAGLTSSGDVYVFDLNFRINASTPALIVLNALRVSGGASWEGRGRWQTYS
ncbi:MAG: hypothetical protein M3Y06_10420, partial [Actinomycetota bacterium]|nr:hypothetical protein [Actinomycetota bacterium]